MSQTISGQCLCGAVAFHGTPLPGRGIDLCHCGQCRRWASGPFTTVRFAGGVVFDREAGLAWFRSSDHGERGFCRDCGSVLFWRMVGAGAEMAVSAGALGEGHGLGVGRHIWVDDKPGWYEFADDAPRLTAAQCLSGEG